MRNLLLAAGASLALAACGESENPSPQRSSADTVTIKTFQFSPDPITVRAGTKITFDNRDQTTHTVTSGGRGKTDGRFDEKLAAGGKATVTFDRPGRFPYVCTLHQGPGMEGQVIVK